MAVSLWYFLIHARLCHTYGTASRSQEELVRVSITTQEGELFLHLATLLLITGFLRPPSRAHAHTCTHTHTNTSHTPHTHTAPLTRMWSSAQLTSSAS